MPPAVAADRLAERRMSEVGRLRGIWLGAVTVHVKPRPACPYRAREALAAQSRYGCMRTQAGMHVALQAVEAAAGRLRCAGSPQVDSVQGAGA